LHRIDLALERIAAAMDREQDGTGAGAGQGSRPIW
jgi:hypothetical protein